MAKTVKKVPANAGATESTGSIPGWEDPLEMTTHSRALFFFFKQLITFLKIPIEKMELGSIVPGELLVSPEEECSMG